MVIFASVTRIVDGDGLVLSTGQGIRLGDFNAPEWNGPGGPEAKQALTDIAYGADLACTPCEGARNPRRCTSYDRIIATCRLNGARLGDLMWARGIAEGGR
jgi:endonuclease YncB( thermonuclease family)